MQRSSRNKIVGFLVGFFLLSTTFFVRHLHKKSNYVPKRNFLAERTDDDGFSRALTEKNIADDFVIAKILVKIMKFFGHAAKFGEYVLTEHISLFDAIEIIASGKVVVHKITIPEGFSVVRFMERLNKNEDLLGEVTEIPPEGSLLPDTYCFKYPTQKQEIIRTAQKAMREFIKKEWPKRSEKCILKTPDEVLTLASIVEKETNIEREIIAGVYFHRLKIKMKLQSCPTAIYAHKKGEVLGHALKYSELTIDDPYNTYVYEGLPPTPIANPGRESIIAVLHPQETDNLFFVYEGEGKHAFAKTYEQHKLNIARIRNMSISDVR
ncbi:MAG: endolytic transglycosylase MltG [Holosporaceae bacterium]|nr:endolytic transglycosylase MltG [Holosporaceae bacterium]